MYGSIKKITIWCQGSSWVTCKDENVTCKDENVTCKDEKTNSTSLQIAYFIRFSKLKGLHGLSKKLKSKEEKSFTFQ